MSANSENIKRWIEQSDIDYITNYIKVWIPFNAWFNAHYASLSTDREKINKIKNGANTVRNAINSFMESDSQEGQEFRSYLASLHYRLQNNQLENKDGIISFNHILKEKNTINLIDNEIIGQNKYYLKRTDGTRLSDDSSIQIFLKKKSDDSLIFRYEHNSYDLSHLQKDKDFVKLSHARKEQLRLFFIDLTPIIITDLIIHNLSERPKNYYKCDSYNFRRDIDNSNCYAISVCKALLETLYQLRNILFHGELVPNNATQKVYKESYSLLKMILDRIK